MKLLSISVLAHCALYASVAYAEDTLDANRAFLACVEWGERIDHPTEFWSVTSKHEDYKEGQVALAHYTYQAEADHPVKLELGFQNSDPDTGEVIDHRWCEVFFPASYAIAGSNVIEEIKRSAAEIGFTPWANHQVPDEPLRRSTLISALRVCGEDRDAVLGIYLNNNNGVYMHMSELHSERIDSFAGCAVGSNRGTD